LIPEDAATSGLAAANGGFELVEHTADIGIWAWGETPADLFRAAARGLNEVLVGAVVRDEAELTEVALQASGWEELLVSWLNELLFLFEARGLLTGRVEFVTLEAESLAARLYGEAYAPARHPLERQVKAATYHQLQVVHRQGRWQATVVLDL